MKTRCLTASLSLSALTLGASLCHAAPKAYVYDHRSGDVSVVDASGPVATHAVTNAYGAPAGLDAMVADADHAQIFLAGDTGAFIKSIDVSDATTDNLPALGLQTETFTAHPDGRRFLFARTIAAGGQEIVVLTRGAQAALRIPMPAGAGATSALVALPDGTAAYAVTFSGRVYRLDLTAGTSSLAVALPGNGGMVRVVATPTSDALLLAWGHTVYRVAVPTHTFTSRQMVAAGSPGALALRALALSPDGRTLNVGQQDVADQTGRGNHRLFKIDAALVGGAPPAQNSGLHLDGPPLNMAAHPDGSTLYVTHAVLPDVSIIDTARMVLQRTLRTGGEPYLVSFVEPIAGAAAASPAFADGVPPLALSEAVSVTLADVTGDGRDDLCGRIVTGLTPGLHCAPNVGNGRFGAMGRWSSEFGVAFSASPSQFTTLRFPDLNGDGRKDVCGRTAAGLVCALSNGSNTFNAPRPWLAAMADGPNGWQRADQFETIQFADLNADGADDVCGRASDGLRCAYSNRSNGFGALVLMSGTFGNHAEWDDGNPYWRTIKLADLNGDRRADVCGRAARGMVCELNNGAVMDGNGAVWAAVVGDATGWHLPQYAHTLQFADMNGDGRQDLCGRGIAGMYCGMSDGRGAFVDFARSVRFDDFSDAHQWNQPRFYETIRLTDVDGDGLPDFCGRGLGGIVCGRSLRTQDGTIVYRAAELRADGFGDDDGFGASQSLWGTVQPARLDRLPGTEFCGRRTTGIVCSGF